ncbi:MAG: 6-phosphofructokinase [Acidobacteria bacterium]|nr:6-phosphofructokinase [Acidobacteriota bacterium]
MTAIDIATEALDRLHTTAASHDRVMVLEVMGRNTGWIALHAGLAGSADVILIPEIPYSFESIVRKVQARENSGSRFTNIVVAEGAIETGKSEIYQDNKEMRLGGVGNYIRTAGQETHRQKTRTVVLGHLQRGGSPNALTDVGNEFWSLCRSSSRNGETGKMVALQAEPSSLFPLRRRVQISRPLRSRQLITNREGHWNIVRRSEGVEDGRGSDVRGSHRRCTKLNYGNGRNQEEAPGRTRRPRASVTF